MMHFMITVFYIFVFTEKIKNTTVFVLGHMLFILTYFYGCLDSLLKDSLYVASDVGESTWSRV